MSTPVTAKGTTPRRSPRLAVRRLDQQAAAPDATISMPMSAALRECIQQHVGGASHSYQVETVVKSHFPQLEVIMEMLTYKTELE